MKIRSCALSATLVLCCLTVANLVAASLPVTDLPNTPLAIYYSFDVPPPAVLFTELKAELDQILAPARLPVAWRSSDAPRNGQEDFPEIAVFSFHGRCSFDGVADSELEPVGLALAETQISDGHVLPFGKVHCDQVRRFIEPATRSLSSEDKDAALGRALARVAAHEIYHMLTKSETHGSEGIARSRHSRADLTASTFMFAKTEINWLRTWVERLTAR
jgi:hypothetical protein